MIVSVKMHTRRHPQQRCVRAIRKDENRGEKNTTWSGISKIPNLDDKAAAQLKNPWQVQAIDLGFSQSNQTCIFIDNLADLYMINRKRPTARAKHIDTQWFAIQEWANKKEIIMKHLSSVLNASDNLTKPLSCVACPSIASRARQ